MTTEITTETTTETRESTGNTTPRPRHIVENNRDGTPQDKALCGWLWDRINVTHNGAICQACVDEQKKRPKW